MAFLAVVPSCLMSLVVLWLRVLLISFSALAAT